MDDANQNIQPQQSVNSQPNAQSVASNAKRVLQPTAAILQEIQSQASAPVTQTPLPEATTTHEELPGNAQAQSSIAAPLANETVTAPGPTTDTVPVNNTGPQSYNTQLLAGSRFDPEKPRLPVGVYIVAGVSLLSFVSSFFNTSQTSALFSIVMLCDLLLGIGLLFRLEVARKIMVWLSVLIIILSSVSIILLVGIQGAVAQSVTNYHVAISRLNRQTLTPAQKQELDAIQTKISTEQKREGKAVGLAYLVQGLSVVESIGIIVYLTRPRVKEIFVELPK